MRRRNLILITVLSLSLTFAAGCGENKNTGAAGSMDQQKTSETTVQNETEPETSQVSEDSEQDETEAAATTEAGARTAQSDYQIEMVSYKNDGFWLIFLIRRLQAGVIPKNRKNGILTLKIRQKKLSGK